NTRVDRSLLPSQRRYFVMNYQDTMAIHRVYGSPNLFVTFTCNTKWREIGDALRFESGHQPYDRSDLICASLPYE
ncbi:unnamed protein product, partial [Urochloa humidicola]